MILKQYVVTCDLCGHTATVGSLIVADGAGWIRLLITRGWDLYRPRDGQEPDSGLLLCPRCAQALADTEPMNSEMFDEIKHALRNYVTQSQAAVLAEPEDQEPPDTNDTPLCSCGEPTCLGICGQPPVTNSPPNSP
jgi:hypothetical protein